MNNNELRVIPKKNYLILSLVILGTVFLVYYFYMWFDAYKEKKLNMRILDSYMEIINYNELDNYLIENPNAIIYVSVLEDANIREFEKGFKKMFKNHEINQQIIYFDVTKNIKDEKIAGRLSSKYGIDRSDLPIVLVFNDGSIYNSFSVIDNNYDLYRLRDFINSVGSDS